MGTHGPRVLTAGTATVPGWTRSPARPRRPISAHRP